MSILYVTPSIPTCKIPGFVFNFEGLKIQKIWLKILNTYSLFIDLFLIHLSPVSPGRAQFIIHIVKLGNKIQKCVYLSHIFYHFTTLSAFELCSMLTALYLEYYKIILCFKHYEKFWSWIMTIHIELSITTWVFIHSSRHRIIHYCFLLCCSFQSSERNQNDISFFSNTHDAVHEIMSTRHTCIHKMSFLYLFCFLLLFCCAGLYPFC